jgi:hypothetical protein
MGNTVDIDTPPGATAMVAAARGLPEPPTPQALWPTFLRRTLAEEEVRPGRAGPARGRSQPPVSRATSAASSFCP